MTNPNMEARIREYRELKRMAEEDLCFKLYLDGYFQALLPAMQKRGIVN